MSNLTITNNSENFNLMKVASEEKKGTSTGWTPIVKNIFSFIDNNETLVNLKRVCKKFKEIVDSKEMTEIKLNNLAYKYKIKKTENTNAQKDKEKHKG